MAPTVRFADSLKCALLALSLGVAWWPVSKWVAWRQAPPGSAADWVMLVTLALALTAPLTAALTILVAGADLYRRRPTWQAALAVLIAASVLYLFRGFP